MARPAKRDEPAFPYVAAQRAAESVGKKSESLILVDDAGLEPQYWNKFSTGRSLRLFVLARQNFSARVPTRTGDLLACPVRFFCGRCRVRTRDLFGVNEAL